MRAGLPEAIDDTDAEALTIDDYLIERPSTTVLIRVKGDSMIDAGIFDGDLVVVEKRPTRAKGDIVVAIVDNQFTLKRLDLEARPVRAARGEQGLCADPPGGLARDLRRDGGAGPQAVAPCCARKTMGPRLCGDDESIAGVTPAKPGIHFRSRRSCCRDDHHSNPTF